MNPTVDPQAIATVLQMAAAPWIAQAIYCVAKLGLADHLKAGPRPVEELARETGTHAPSLGRLLRALASVGLFATDPKGWRVTPLGEALRADVPGSARGYAIMLGSPFHRAAWTDILESVRTGKSAFDRVHGVPAFEYLARTPADAAIFDEAMTSISGNEIRALLEAYDFSGFTHVVDVAGGRGHVLAAILERNSKILGTLFDLPHAIAGARKALAGSPVAGRVSFVEGDFFGAIPAGGDAYFLKHIIHDWDDPECLKILANVRKVVPPHGRLLVAECVVPPGDGPSFAKLLDLEMLVLTAQGRERTGEEYRDLFARAGFELTRIVPTAGDVAMVEARPA
jgi:ubiquinone/menaquinone biosynthesis C-methylase UbiE